MVLQIHLWTITWPHISFWTVGDLQPTLLQNLRVSDSQNLILEIFSFLLIQFYTSRMRWKAENERNNMMVSMMTFGTFFLVVFSSDLWNSEVKVKQHQSYEIYMNIVVNRIKISFPEHQRTCNLDDYKPRNLKESLLVEVTESKL